MRAQIGDTCKQYLASLSFSPLLVHSTLTIDSPLIYGNIAVSRHSTSQNETKLSPEHLHNVAASVVVTRTTNICHTAVAFLKART